MTVQDASSAESREIAPLGSLWRDRSFIRIWAAMLFSTAATFLFLLAISIAVLEKTGSNLLAASIFSCHWILPVIGARQIGKILTEVTIRSVLKWAELANVLATILVVLAVNYSLWVVIGIFVVRGFTEALSKSGRTVAIKLYISPERLGRAAALFNTSQFLGSALGALFGAALIALLPLSEIALLAITGFLLATVCYLGLDATTRAAGSTQSTNGSHGRAPGASSDLGSNPVLFRAFHYLVLTTSIFQGYHTVARTALPTIHLGLPAESAVTVSLLSSVAVLVGALFVGSFWNSSVVTIRTALVLIGSTVLTMVIPLFSVIVPLAFTGYFLFMFVFELGFAKFQKTIVMFSPADTIGHITASCAAYCTAGMAIVVMATGLLADYIGLMNTTFLLATLTFVWVAAIEFFAHRIASRIY